ncbi:hypothetical protein ACFL47_00395 [Candidatus Latescibacterota bacterium]
MKHLNSLDYSIIVIYFMFLIALGLYLKNRASQSLDDYFLGGRQIPWWALGISGMASWLDVCGDSLRDPPAPVIPRHGRACTVRQPHGYLVFRHYPWHLPDTTDRQYGA